MLEAMTDSSNMSLRGRLASLTGRAATWASQKTGRGSGGMIGGLIARRLDPNILPQLAGDTPAVIVTGTNGKSTTTRMLAAAMRTRFTVATNDGGDNMDEGVISALMAASNPEYIAVEVDELHVPRISQQLNTKVIVLLNLTRDQLDRVGEINKIERTLRDAINACPEATIIANCDDVMVTSVAYDHPNVVWVSVGRGFSGDATSCPRTGSAIMHSGTGTTLDWYATKPLPNGEMFRRPKPQWRIDDVGIHRDTGVAMPLELQLPGRANRGNAAQAIAAADVLGIPVEDAVDAAQSVSDVAGRYSTLNIGNHDVHMLLAKNPAGWQEALAMLDRSAEGVVISVNGHIADGEDLSWLWDVKFEDFGDTKVVAAGERATDLAVRLTYAGIEHTVVADTLDAIRSCPAGRVEVLANYTAFRDLRRAILRASDAHRGPAERSSLSNPFQKPSTAEEA